MKIIIINLIIIWTENFDAVVSSYNFYIPEYTQRVRKAKPCEPDGVDRAILQPLLEMGFASERSTMALRLNRYIYFDILFIVGIVKRSTPLKRQCELRQICQGHLLPAQYFLNSKCTT